MVDKKVVIGSTSDSVVKPGDVTRISPAVNIDVSEDSVETSNIARIKTAEEDKGKKTIKLKPVTVAESPSGAAPSQDDETVKIQKPRPVATSTVPGVKQTIKLRPSSNTPAPDTEDTVSFAPPPQQQAPAPEAAPVESAPAAKRTIRLVPKKADATGGGNDVATAAISRPSAPTVKLEEPAQAAAPVSRSSVTVRLPSEGGSEQQPSAPPKRTLKLKPVKAAGEPAPAPAPAPSPAGATDSEMAAIGSGESSVPPMAATSQESGAAAGTATSDEPSMIHAVLAFAALFVMLYFTWTVVGQYCNNYLESKIAVPGLSEKVK
ncbi:MAG: hypothetical protein WAX69_18000 [Victivallales bacterium]